MLKNSFIMFIIHYVQKLLTYALQNPDIYLTIYTLISTYGADIRSLTILTRWSSWWRSVTDTTAPCHGLCSLRGSFRQCWTLGSVLHSPSLSRWFSPRGCASRAIHFDHIASMNTYPDKPYTNSARCEATRHHFPQATCGNLSGRHKKCRLGSVWRML